MNYPNSDVYDKLYARYLQKSVRELVDLADVKGKVVWDLCAGAGRLSREALRQGASLVVALDESLEMLEPLFDWRYENKRWAKRLIISCNRMRVSSGYLDSDPDILFCRQAVNYWFGKVLIDVLAEKLPKGGKFIFNTFNKRPPIKPMVKEYEFKGHHFMETSWRVSKTKMVHHIQVRDGMEPHFTSFRWIPASEFTRVLEPHFNIKIITNGNTDMYVCTSKRKGKRSK